MQCLDQFQRAFQFAFQFLQMFARRLNHGFGSFGNKLFVGKFGLGTLDPAFEFSFLLVEFFQLFGNVDQSGQRQVDRTFFSAAATGV